MASSFTDPQRKYDVFLSFRGTDTRRGFLSHLHKALCEKNIETFTDYKLEEGNEISSSLLTAIEKSEISLIIFSKDYAFSIWCLEELANIIECMEKYEQTVVPIFYDIDPSSVRNQKGSYEDAFNQHERRSRHNMVKLQNWRIALQKAANLSGFHSSNFQTEAELIEKVVECVLKRLNSMDQIYLNGFVAIQERIAHLESLMCPSSPTVRIIGIWGMAGIGKTTIANVVYNRLCLEYEGHHFLENVRQELEKCGMTKLKNKLLSKLLKKDVNIDMHIHVPPYVKRRLGRKKLLVVLDDVNDSEQLNILTGGHDWFGPGSRIIMTSRDRNVLKESDQIYNVEALNADEALQLFNLNAFKEGCVDTKRTMLSLRIVNYANGIPLAVKVLGSYLRSKSQDEWESELEKLQKIPFPKIQNVLKLSYDGLDDEEKDIFLYVACFFHHDLRERITSCLDACGFSTTIALRDLEDKTLITSKGEYVWVHDLIREMGLEIVREKSRKDPSKRCHLWEADDISRVLNNNIGTEAIESIRLDMSRLRKELHLTSQAFARMVNLKFFKLGWTDNDGHPDDFACNLLLPDEVLKLPSELRYFHWAHWPLRSFRLSLCPESLVELCMPYSRVQRLWDGIQDFGNLKAIDLSHSLNLLELPDLSKTCNLEKLTLSWCVSLRRLCQSNLSSHKLVSLNLSGCKELVSVGSDICLRSLQFLHLYGCSSLQHFSLASEMLTDLNLGGTAIRELHSSIGQLRSLQKLNLSDCQNLNTVPEELSKLRSLQYIYLNRNCNLTKLPDNLGFLWSLTVLTLYGSNVENLPASIVHLSQLIYFDIGNCQRLRSVLGLPSSLHYFSVADCASLEIVFTSNVMTEAKKILIFKFINCRRLNKQALDAIEMDYQCRIQAVAKKAMTDDHHGCFKASLCIPGSKVPDRFCYRTSQNSIWVTLELPPLYRLTGFIFCFVSSRLQSNVELDFKRSVRCNCYLEVSNGRRIKYVSHVVRDHDAWHTISDHVYLWYESSISLEIMKGIEGMFKASAIHQNRKVSFQFLLEVDSKVKKIGKRKYGTVSFEVEPEPEPEPGFMDMIKEWGVYPICALDKLDLLGAKKMSRSLD